MTDEQGEYKICKQCGKKYYRTKIPYINNQKYYTKNGLVEKYCQTKTYRQRSKSSFEKSKFCSPECKQNSQKVKSWDCENKWYFCSNCKKRETKSEYIERRVQEFGRTSREYEMAWYKKFRNGSKNIFCSKQCANEYNAKLSTGNPNGNPNGKGIQVKRLEKHYQAEVEKRGDIFWVNVLPNGSVGWRPISKSVHKELVKITKKARTKISSTRKRMFANGELVHPWQHPNIVKNCRICNKVFEVKFCKRNSISTCGCSDCYKELRRRNAIKANIKRWGVKT